jgi:hypothetical protein
MATCARKAQHMLPKWSAQSTISALPELLSNARLALTVRSLGLPPIQSASSAHLAMCARNSTLLDTSARPGYTALGRSVLSQMVVEHALMEESAQLNAPLDSIVRKALSRLLIAQLELTKIKRVKPHAKFAQQGSTATAKA